MSLGRISVCIGPRNPLSFRQIHWPRSLIPAASFALFGGAPTKYLPATLLYFDDTLGAPSRMGSLFRNRWCGQLAAIGEFNARAGPRKIDALRILPYRRPGSAAKWMAQSYALHVLDHPLRQEGRVAAPQTVAEQDASADASWPF